jgi:hypothetical protein
MQHYGWLLKHMCCNTPIFKTKSRHFFYKKIIQRLWNKTFTIVLKLNQSKPFSNNDQNAALFHKMFSRIKVLEYKPNAMSKQT